MSTCILSIDTCLLAICERGLDDSSHVSPLHLPTTCIHSTFSTVARLLFGIFSILIIATCLDAHCARGIDDSVHESPLPTVCTTLTLAFAMVLLFLLSDLNVTESSTDSTLIWLLSSLAVHAVAGCLSKSEGHLYCLFTTPFDGVLVLKTLMSPLVQLAPLSGPCLVPQVQVGIRETRLYHPRSGTLP